MMEDIAIGAAIFMAVLVYFQTVRVDYYKKMFEIVDASNNQLIRDYENMLNRAHRNAEAIATRLPHLRAQIDEEMARLRKENGGV